MNHRPDKLFTLVKIMLLKKFSVKNFYRSTSPNCVCVISDGHLSLMCFVYSLNWSSVETLCPIHFFYFLYLSSYMANYTDVSPCDLHNGAVCICHFHQWKSLFW